jgi:hypothetical protein
MRRAEDVRRIGDIFAAFGIGDIATRFCCVKGFLPTFNCFAVALKRVVLLLRTPAPIIETMRMVARQTTRVPPSTVAEPDLFIRCSGG